MGMKCLAKCSCPPPPSPWQNVNLLPSSTNPTGCVGPCPVVVYKLRATLRKAVVWSVRGLAIGVQVESRISKETRALLP